MAKVTLKKIDKIYSDGKSDPFHAVKGIDLEIRDREFMVLVGPSGCGKSTSLRMIAGLEEISGGELYIGDRVVNDVLPKDRDIAMVFQNYALYPHMTVFDNMAFGLKLMKYPKDEIKKRVLEASDILGLDSMLERKPKALSGGQRQRVAVGRAIVRKPKVFLFDEPLSNLDAKMRVSMRTEISKLHAKLDATMIYVTHDQIEAMTMGDRITVMKDGNIMQVAEPIELYNSPQNMFVAGFIGSPPMNFMHGRLDKSGDTAIFTEDNEKGEPVKIKLTSELTKRCEAYLGKRIVFGIRPEDLEDAGQETGEDIISARVDVAEPMGSETYLYLDTGAHALIARVHSAHRFQINEKSRVRANLAKAHFFDPETEKVIR